MSIIKKISIATALLLSACGAQTDVPTTQFKDTPETRKMLTDFAKQQHRFEFSGCDMKYNGALFNLNMSIQELSKVLGVHSRISQTKKNNAYFWFDDVIKVLESKKNREISTLVIRLRKIDTSNKPFYFLVDGAPLEKKMTMGDFLSISHYDFNDFLISNNSYKIIFDQCKHPVRYFMESKVNFSYIGYGHTRLKDKPDLDTTYPIKAFQISAHKN